jgi:hypothetical protein
LKAYKSGGCNGEEKPDVNNLESSDWKCVFCSRGPDVRNIVHDPSGDLFGPYYVSIPKVVKSNDNPKRKVFLNHFFIIGHILWLKCNYRNLSII